MKWERLLALEKLDSNEQKKRTDETDTTRNSFEKDYDRVVFSDAFRSLQDKTQVIPFSKSDFVHTRLTHSLEVSVVGRSLGRIVGSNVIERHPDLRSTHGYEFNDFGAIVAAACLAHDIGNPPFGHGGESAIGSFFTSGQGREIIQQFTPKQRSDLESFEGNANGFKILAKGNLSNILGAQSGTHITNATLGAFIKYPKDSAVIEQPSCVSEKKYGYFQDDEDDFKRLAQNLGLIKKENNLSVSYCRHPLAYLVEAADDICYLIMDLEDGTNLGWIQESDAVELLNTILPKNKKLGNKAIPNKKEKMGYLRGTAINILIQEAAQIFIKNENKFLNGSFNSSLLGASQYYKILQEIRTLSKEKIYNSPFVIEKLITGYQALHNILSRIILTMENVLNNKQSYYDQLLMQLIPKDLIQTTKSKYVNCLNICTYVASMSDGNILDLHSKLNGIKH